MKELGVVEAQVVAGGDVQGAQDESEQLGALKKLIRVGLRVYVENGLHEMLVPVKVCEVNEEGFKIEHKGRKTQSKWTDASFVQNGRERPTLFDKNHGYTHIV